LLPSSAYDLNAAQQVVVLLYNYLYLYENVNDDGQLSNGYWMLLTSEKGEPAVLQNV